MAQQIKIREVDRTRTAYQPGNQQAWNKTNGNILLLVTEDITAGTYNSTESRMEPGKGKGVPYRLTDVSGTDVLVKVEGRADVDVYNYSTSAVTAGPEAFVWVERSQQDGELYLQLGGGGDELYKFVLTEDMGATTTGEASATITKPDGSGSVTGEVVKDHPAGIFESLVTDREGWALKVGSDYWIIQANCPPPGYEEGTGDGSLEGSGTFIYT